jgi:hypothetical protein
MWWRDSVSGCQLAERVERSSSFSIALIWSRIAAAFSKFSAAAAASISARISRSITDRFESRNRLKRSMSARYASFPIFAAHGRGALVDVVEQAGAEELEFGVAVVDLD